MPMPTPAGVPVAMMVPALRVMPCESSAMTWSMSKICRPVLESCTDTDFANSKSLSNYTLGIGYRGTMIYADLAYKFSSYKEDFYPFYNEFNDRGIVTPNVTKITNTRSQVLFTLGMRF